MENAADALQMAAAVLIFVLALTIAINSFGQASQASELILGYNDREYDYSYVENNGSTERIVSLESIVPSIYKAYRENYRIVFDNLPEDDYLFEKRNDEGDFIKVYQIDMETGNTGYGVALGSDEQKLQFIMAVLYGDKIEDYYNEDFQTIYDRFERNSGIRLKREGIYDIIKENNWKFKESIGVYYQEQASGENNSTTTPGITTSGDSVPEANLTEKRVITYTIQ